MKRYLYPLCFFIVALVGLSACSKNDPEPVSPVVGRWELNKALLSGFVAPNTSLNGVGLDLYSNGLFAPYASRIDIRADKSFLDNSKSNGIVGDFSGTWEYTSDQLTLRYDDGNSETFTYRQTGGLEEILSSTYDITLPVDSVSTAKGKFQYVYRK